MSNLASAKWDGNAWKPDDIYGGPVSDFMPKYHIGAAVRYLHSGITRRGIISDILRMNFIPGLCRLDGFETFYVVQPVNDPHEHWVKERDIV